MNNTKSKIKILKKILLVAAGFFATIILAFSPLLFKLITFSEGKGIVLFWPNIVKQYINIPAELKTVVQDRHLGRINSLTFSQDGKNLASAGDDRVIRFWDLAAGKRSVLFDPRNSDNPIDREIASLAFSPKGKKLAIAYGNDSIFILDINTFGQAALLMTEENFPQISFSTDGKYLFAVDMNKTEVWETSSGDLKRKASGMAASFSPNSRLLITAEISEPIKILDIATGKVIKTIEEHIGFVESLSVSPDGKFLALIDREEKKQGYEFILKIFDINRGRLIKIFRENEGVSQFVSFSPDGKYLIFYNCDSQNKTTISVVDAKTFNLYQNFSLNADVNTVAFHPNNKYLALGCGDGSIKLVDLITGVYVKDISAAALPTIISSSGRYFASFDKDVVVWDTEKLVPLKALKNAEITGKRLMLSPNGRYVAIEPKNGEGFISLWDIETNSLMTTLSTANHSPTHALSFSADNKYLASAGWEEPFKATIKIWDIETGALEKTLIPKNNIITSLEFSADGRYLASAGDVMTSYNKAYEGFIEVFDINKAEITQSIDKFSGISRIAFSPNSNLLAFTLRQGPKHPGENVPGYSLNTLELESGKIDKLHEGEIYSPINFSPDGKYLIFLDSYSGLKLFDIENKRIVKTFNNYRKPAEFLSSTAKMILLRYNDEYGIKLLNIKGDKELATFFPFPDASIILTPEGFFSGTGDFNKYAHFVKKWEVYGFNQFYDVFYRPDLVEKKLNGEDISKYTQGLNIEGALKNPPPQAVILSLKDGESVTKRNINVTFQVKDTGGGIGDIRIYHNGKLVDSLGVYRLARPEQEDNRLKIAKADTQTPYRGASRGLMLIKIQENQAKKDFQPTVFVPIKGNIEKTYNITLINGQNTISVAAFNGTNTVMSAMESVRINADIPKKEPNLFLLTIGNNHFKNHSYDLSLATKDANDFSSMIKKTAGILYGKVINQDLRNANKSLIIDAVKSLSKDMAPEDTFILYVATHGKAEDDLYYLYSSDFDGNPYLHESSISSIELMELSKKIPALKQVFVLDTCSAGGVESIVAGLYDTRISVLAKSLGMHIFAGSKTYQEAIDDYKGNGLFTYFLLEGLNGKADKNNDKEITLVELNPYLTLAVKEASQGKQEPFIRNFGEDFPLSELAK